MNENDSFSEEQNADSDSSSSNQILQKLNRVKSEVVSASSFLWAKEKVLKQQHKSTISKYKKGLDWNEKEFNEKIDLGEPKITINDIKEKSFQKRLLLFLLRTFLPTLGLSIAMTAPITFPWLFEFIIPDIMISIPPFIKEIIQNTVDFFQSLLSWFSWLEPVIDFLMQLSATFNPFLVYVVIIYVLNETEIIHDEHYEDPFNDLSNIPSSVDFFAADFQRKFDLSFSEMALFLLIISFCILIFLVIRREKEIMFEFLTLRDEKKYLEKIAKAFIGYYEDKGIEEVNYIKTRFSESPKLNVLSYLVKLSPILSFVIPVILAIIFIFL